MDVSRYADHSPYSDPRHHAPLLAAVPPEPASLHAAVTTAVVHYRAGTTPPTPAQLDDVDRRWVASILDAVADRAPGPLDAPRSPEQQVGGCCRDHSLLAVAVLREHDVPARTRLGFVDYLGAEGFRHDHVVAERHDGARWVRFDPEAAPDDVAFDPHDLPTGEDAPFETAAEVWSAYRAGRRDLTDHGAGPDLPWLTGPGFVQRYVLADLAHRQRHELLLWDVWGASVLPGGTPDEGTVALTDRVAELTVLADGGDRDAEAALTVLWATDERLRPGRFVTTWSPTGRLGSTDLATRRTGWAAVPADAALVG
ncbi:transglutaminase-like domain-containing protein [Cellulosimicrobium protaetiae]|uniref:Transglutaminase domain-containing protein n=1 Tax=Cellulosimicrobium protaetiae TaxID=2587808 RepID=A0A6M5UFL7_9MICO|nr:transglutaminase-like domain-containing protein [Cellulosimicrobium protaetiae]QJW35419.1 transglutaminase domain-containing protein [Cellulosimicrobium protaetiae]